MKDNPRSAVQPALFVGIDWADEEHEIHVLDEQGNGYKENLEQAPEAITQWVNAKLKEADGKPIAIILEQSRGTLVHALMFRENVILYPINPKQLAAYRDSYTNAGCKGDESDAWLLARMLYERKKLLKPWLPDDESTRMLSHLCRTRRRIVDEHTRLILQLTSHLKTYFPLVFKVSPKRSITPLVLELIKRCPDPRRLKRVDRRIFHKILKSHGYRNEDQRDKVIQSIRSSELLTSDAALIEPVAVMAKALATQIPVLRKAIAELEERISIEMKNHPDKELFTMLPGAGEALAPRLLVAFGSHRERFKSADEFSTFTGIAPAMKQSGKSRHVHRRYACNKYLRQTFHEFADHARRWCAWSRAYYRLQRSRGMKHHAALRKLASRWIRILFQVWKKKIQYDPAAYLANIQKKNPAIKPFLNKDLKTC